MEAGLPDHTHFGNASPNDMDRPDSQGYPYNDSHQSYRTSDRVGIARKSLGMSQASISNDMYGSSTTVTPQSTSCMLCIRY